MAGRGRRRIGGAAGSTRAPRRSSDGEDLLSRLIHDLKNPLGVVLSYAEMLSGAGAAERDEFSVRLRVNAHRSIQVLDEFALLHDLRRGRLDCAAAECDWHDVVDGALEQLQPVLEGSLGRVKCERGAPVPIRADAWMLARALRCLLRESLRATRDDSLVRVVPRLCGASAELCLSTAAAREVGSEDQLLLDDQGLEIELMREVAALHGGTVSVSHDRAGMQVIVRLPPVAASRAG